MTVKKLRRLITALGIFTVVMLFAISNHETAVHRQLSPKHHPQARLSTLDFGQTDEGVGWNTSGIPNEIVDMINTIKTYKTDFFPDQYWATTMDKLSKSLNEKRRKSGAAVLRFQNERGMKTTGHWVIVDSHIQQYALYDPDDPAVEALLRDMATLPFEEISANDEGTQLKVNVKFKGGGWAILKAMRAAYKFLLNIADSNPLKTYANHLDLDQALRLPRIAASISSFFERHYAEIAAFHLDRILGAYRVPPTTGRHVNITSELIPLLPETIRKTIHTDEGGRVCFYGNCKQACSKHHSFCGSPDTLEASLMYILPNTSYANAPLIPFWNPWKRLRKGIQRPEWVSREYLCQQARHEYSKGKALPLEILDVMYFDTLIGNNDRHHLVVYDVFNDDTIPFLFDNGRAFGNSKGILLNVSDRCCLMKKTTFLKYLKLFLGPDKLSELMRLSLRSDPVDPVLLDDGLRALDERVKRTVLYIHDCLKEYSVDHVIINDINP